MASLNKVFVIGNLTRDPELRYIPSGTAVVNLRIAVNRRFRDRNGGQKEETCFITAVVWDKQAEACNQYLRKGNATFVEGRLQSRSWESPDGSKRNTIEIRAERVQFLNNLRKAKEKLEDSTDALPEETKGTDENLTEDLNAATWPDGQE